MATHSVPQDVEADDKLIGFLSLKQFIFTILGLGFGYLTFFFFTKVHPLSAIIWLPFSLVFFVLGLYQRKDQPVEVYLASALGFYLKPHTRIWNQEGYEERVIITAPPVIEKHYTKNFTGEEAVSRLEGLSLMMDSRGWASKKVTEWQNPQFAAVVTDSDRLIDTSEVAASQGYQPPLFAQPADPYDETSRVGQDFENKIEQTYDNTHQQAIQVMQQAQQQASPGQTTQALPNDGPPSVQVPVQVTPSPTQTTDDSSSVTDDDSKATVPSNTSAAEPPSSSASGTASKSELPIEKIELNVPHQIDDGSVELRLH